MPEQDITPLRKVTDGCASAVNRRLHKRSMFTLGTGFGGLKSTPCSLAASTLC